VNIDLITTEFSLTLKPNSFDKRDFHH